MSEQSKSERIRELVEEVHNLRNEIELLNQKNRRLVDYPPELTRHIIIDHKPMPEPICGQCQWLAPNGAVIWRQASMLTYPTTKIWFDPTQLGMETGGVHEQYGLEITWKRPNT